MRRRAGWLAMYAFSAVIGLGVLAVLCVQAAACARLYWHPAPFRQLLATARDHADEYAGGAR